MAYRNVQRTVHQYGLERYPSTALGANNGFAPYQAFMNSLVRNSQNDLCCVTSRSVLHAGVPSVGVFHRSTDNGRSWGNLFYDAKVIFNQDPLQRSCVQSVMKTRAGRLLCAAFLQDVNNTQTTTPWLPEIDDFGNVIQTVALPTLPDGSGVNGAWTVPSNFVELPSGRLLCAVYTRKPPNNGAKSFIMATDDPTYKTGWFQLGTVAADPNYVIEYKEPYLGLLQDGRLMCLVRGDDSATGQRTGVYYSSDGGATWSGPTTTIDCWNFPAWIQKQSGEVVVVSRHRTGQPSDGTDYPSAFIAPDASMSPITEIPLYDPNVGQGVGSGSGVIEMENGRIGIMYANAPPPITLNQTRCEFCVLDPNPESAGEYAVYDLDSAPRPSQYGDLNPWSWYQSEYFRTTYLPASTGVARWPNSLGLPSRDLVQATGTKQLVFQDGSDFVDGLIGGKGILVNHDGARHMALEFPPTPIPQPWTLIVVCDANAFNLDLALLDNGAGSECRWRSAGTALNYFYFISGAGQQRRFTYPSGGFGAVKNPAVCTLIGDGANSSMRVDGAALSVSQAGVLGTGALSDTKLNGTGNDGFFTGIAAFVVLQTNNLSRIGDLENAFLAKYRVLG